MLAAMETDVATVAQRLAAEHNEQLGRIRQQLVRAGEEQTPLRHKIAELTEQLERQRTNMTLAESAANRHIHDLQEQLASQRADAADAKLRSQSAHADASTAGKAAEAIATAEHIRAQGLSEQLAEVYQQLASANAQAHHQSVEAAKLAQHDAQSIADLQQEVVDAQTALNNDHMVAARQQEILVAQVNDLTIELKVRDMRIASLHSTHY